MRYRLFAVVLTLFFMVPSGFAQKTGHAAAVAEPNASARPGSNSGARGVAPKGYFLPDGTWVDSNKRSPAPSKFQKKSSPKSSGKAIISAPGAKPLLPAGAKVRSAYSLGLSPMPQAAPVAPTTRTPASRAEVEKALGHDRVPAKKSSKTTNSKAGENSDSSRPKR